MARLFVPATLFAGYPRWVWIAAVLVLVLATAYVVAELVARLLRLGARTLLGVRLERDERGTLGPALRLARGVVFLLVALALTFPGLKLAGVETTVGLRPEALGRWLMVSGLRIVLIVLVSTLLLRFTAALSRRFEEEVAATGGTDAAERLRRVRTLGTIARNTAGVLVTGIALLMVLRELNLDITPILTGAGIAGLAVGFGAQSLVKDVISGFFMILENQVRVGDVASINGTGGLVEAITLRTIVLRDVNGTVHVFPNGSITTLSNMSKDFAYAVLDIALAYDEDPDRVTAILRGIDEEIRADAAYKGSILEPLEVLGIDQFGESNMILRTRVKTLPLKQWEIGREMRRRIRARFRAEGIEVPYRRQVLLQQQPVPPLASRPEPPPAGSGG